MAVAVKNTQKQIPNFSCPVQLYWISLACSKYFADMRISDMRIFISIFNVLLMNFFQMYVKILLYFVNVQNGIRLPNWIILAISVDLIMTCRNILLNLTILAGEQKFPKTLRPLDLFSRVINYWNSVNTKVVDGFFEFMNTRDYYVWRKI